jgi:acyl-CoA synthetase (AMP-forming)/AMP-acid ligase II
MYKMGLLQKNIFPDIRISLFCGEPLPKHLADAWQKAAPNSSVENLYGPTEATIWLTRYVYSEVQRYKSFTNSILPIGLPFDNHTIAIVNESGIKLPNDQVGEIVYKGPQISKGYLNDIDKTKLAFVKFAWDSSGSTWYKSGDLGFFNRDGYLECIGRRDGQIKIGGRRVEIGEIEATLHRYPLTQDAVVLPLKDPNDQIYSCVALVTTVLLKDQELDIRKDSEKYLERIFFPKKILHINTFPLTPSGKIDRNALSSIANEIMAKSSRSTS